MIDSRRASDVEVSLRQREDVLQQLEQQAERQRQLEEQLAQVKQQLEAQLREASTSPSRAAVSSPWSGYCTCVTLQCMYTSVMWCMYTPMHVVHAHLRPPCGVCTGQGYMPYVHIHPPSEGGGETCSRADRMCLCRICLFVVASGIRVAVTSCVSSGLLFNMKFLLSLMFSKVSAFILYLPTERTGMLVLPW